MRHGLRQYPNYDTYRPGNAWFICDRCGQRHRRSAMFTEWDGLKVDAKCLDPRPPQMMPPNVYPEGIPFYDARPPQDQPDRLVDDTTLYAIVGGIAATTGLYASPTGQALGPGALSPQDIVETVPVTSVLVLDTESGLPVLQENGQPIFITVPGVPQGPNVLEDDITFITGPVFAPTVPGES